MTSQSNARLASVTQELETTQKALAFAVAEATKLKIENDELKKALAVFSADIEEPRTFEDENVRILQDRRHPLLWYTVRFDPNLSKHSNVDGTFIANYYGENPPSWFSF